MRTFPVILFCLTSLAHPAGALTLLIGDNDGFGVGIPDGGNGSAITNFTFGDTLVDFRTPDEVAATNGAQITDLYDAVMPGSVPVSPFFSPDLFTLFGGDALDPADPRIATMNDIVFTLPEALVSGSVTFDILDWQTPGYMTATVAGEALDLGAPGAFSESFLRTATLTPAQIAASNAAGEVRITLAHAYQFEALTGVDDSGDFLAIDFIRLDGVTDPGVTPVPLPGSAGLIVLGMGLLLGARRRLARLS